MRVLCDECGNPIPGPSAFRLRAGVAEAEEWIQDESGYHAFKMKFLDDEFQDGELVRYLCESCAQDHTIFMHRFRRADKRPPDQCPLCDRPVETTMEIEPSRLIQIEYGLFGVNKCNALHFATQHVGYVCEECAWSELDFPFGCLQTSDIPPIDYEPEPEPWRW